MEDISAMFPMISVEENARTKNWACGSSQPAEYQEFVINIIDNKPVSAYRGVTYAPAWWKIIDEVLVNAVDHFIKNLGTTHPVTAISIDFDPATGSIKVTNNGPGIPVVMHTAATESLGRPIWLPTFLFGMFGQGGNHTPAPDAIVGGINGFGAKLAIIYSTEAILETVDIPRGKYFQQRWENNMKIARDPTVIDLARPHKLNRVQAAEHTTLKFTPDYAGTFGAPWIAEMADSLKPLLRARAWFASAYCNFSSPGKCKISFCGEAVNTTLSGIAALQFPGAPVLHAILPAPNHPTMHYPMEVVAVIVDSTQFKQKNMSNVNGIMVHKGNHHKHIMDILTEGTKSAMSKLFKHS